MIIAICDMAQKSNTGSYSEGTNCADMCLCSASDYIAPLVRWLNQDSEELGSH